MTRTDPSITLCMIARDEEALIGQAISSVRGIVQQVVVVDTGSTDSTCSIAASLGAEILQIAWADDFAFARNTGLARATCDWILVLDADEAIAPEQLPLIVEHTHTIGNCFELTQRHYSNDHRLSGFEPARGEYPAFERSYSGFFESSLVRLFPNHLGVQYVGRIHELVEPWIAQTGALKILRSPVRLHHYGHTDEVVEKKNKNRLYRALGQAKLQDQPQDWKAFFELGVECNRPDQREESVSAFRRSLELNPSHVPTWINLGYVLCELGRCTEAVDTLSSALSLDPSSCEAHCNIGVAFLRLKDPVRAEGHFREAVRLNANYVNAYMNLSRALAAQGRLPESILIAERALELAPRSPQAIAELGILYAAGGSTDVGISLLKTALQLDPSLEDARSFLVQLSTNQLGR